MQVATVASATDTAFGFFLNANPNSNNGPSSWTGGMPYNQKPAGIRGYYKYNVATADSATIIVTFSKAGSNIGAYFFEIGGIQNSYKLFDFTFNPALPTTPDSVIFGVVSCKIGNQGQPIGIPGSTLKIDSVSFTGVSSQPALMNGDFELWQTQTINSPVGWHIESDMGEGFNRTTDAKKGIYAIELITYPGNTNNHPAAQAGRISTGYYPNNCNGNCVEQGGYSFSHQTDTLAFYYKYAPTIANDKASVQMNFKKNGNQIDGRGIDLLASSSYQYIEVPFSLMQTPDTVIIDIQSSGWQDSLLSYVGANLKIDEIHFKSQPLNTGIFNYGNGNTISIFPNPATTNITIECPQKSVLTATDIEIENIEGQIIKNITISENNTIIDVSAFPSGMYIVKCITGKGIEVRKFVKE